jgi:hypothetical protein
MNHLCVATTTTAGSPALTSVPQIVDIDVDSVTLVWQPVARSDTAVHGYQVQYRHAGEQQWHPAHAGLVHDAQCTSWFEGIWVNL